MPQKRRSQVGLTKGGASPVARIYHGQNTELMWPEKGGCRRPRSLARSTENLSFRHASTPHRLPLWGTQHQIEEGHSLPPSMRWVAYGELSGVTPACGFCLPRGQRLRAGFYTAKMYVTERCPLPGAPASCFRRPGPCIVCVCFSCIVMDGKGKPDY